MKPDHVLVPTDLSETSHRHQGDVAALARRLGARVTLLTVVEDPPAALPMAPRLTAPGVEKRIEEARADLEARRPLFEPDVDATVDVATGTDPAATIAEYAATHDVDLVAMTTHGRTGLRHLAMGSVAEGLLRRRRFRSCVFPRAGE